MRQSAAGRLRSPHCARRARKSCSSVRARLPKDAAARLEQATAGNRRVAGCRRRRPDAAQVYESRFTEHDIRTAQILLTHADLADRERYLNARSTMLTLLRLGVVPIINENDTVVTDEIKFGDNDTLGALVANLIEGDALIILTDQSGLFTADPRKDPTATLVAEANAGAPGSRRWPAALQPRPRRDADEDPRGEARGAQRREHRDRERPGGRRARASGGR